MNLEITPKAREAADATMSDLNSALDNQCQCAEREHGCDYCSAMMKFEKNLASKFQLFANELVAEKDKEIERLKLRLKVAVKRNQRQ